MVIPSDDPTEPCDESETVELIREIAEHAERGAVDRIKQYGQIYELIGEPPPVHFASPRLARPEDTADFVEEVSW